MEDDHLLEEKEILKHGRRPSKIRIIIWTFLSATDSLSSQKGQKSLEDYHKATI